MDFRLPPLGEGIDAATVVGVLVKPGDAVTAGQNVIAAETDKAAFEVPIDVAGTVTEIKVKPGDKIPVGAEVLVLQASGGSNAPVAPTAAAAAKPAASQPPLAKAQPPSKSNDFTP